MFYCSYKAGDVVMIKPQNSSEVVQQFVLLLHLDPQATFTLKQNDQGIVYVNCQYLLCTWWYVVCVQYIV